MLCRNWQSICSWLIVLSLSGGATALAAELPTDSPELLAANADPRPPQGDAQLRQWLENMQAHRFSREEMAAATGLSPDELTAACKRWPGNRLDDIMAKGGKGLLVLPYPGGRHPRMGFLDGAVRPQRETKLSVFCPWPGGGYVVADIPEALWSNLGLTYLAHTHVPTIWSQQGLELPKLEWQVAEDGTSSLTRRLPNGIEYTAQAKVQGAVVRMKLRLTNGTPEPLSDLRVQNCVMLKGATGFTEQTNDNKLFRAPYCAAHDSSGRRWVITAWTPNHRAWGNAPCPCLHSDPKFPDCPPGESREVRGWLSFFVGNDIDAELARIEATGWQHDTAP